jgi:hypothetical protein
MAYSYTVEAIKVQSDSSRQATAKSESLRSSSFKVFAGESYNYPSRKQATAKSESSRPRRLQRLLRERYKPKIFRVGEEWKTLCPTEHSSVSSQDKAKRSLHLQRENTTF